MYKQIILEIAKELNIKATILSNNWIIKLDKDNKTKYIAGYKFDLNTHASGEIVDDKYAMYCVLSNEDIPMIEHKIIYRPDNHNNYAQDSNNYSVVYKYYQEHQNNIVIKNNTGTCGREVVHITNEQDIAEVLDTFFKENFSLSICPFYDIEDEYRAIIINGKIKTIYKKERPIVIGNGKKLISELLQEFNPYYKYKILDDRILKKGEKYIYSWQHNLSRGARISEKVESLDILKDLAIKTAKVLNLNFGSIDIIKVKDNYMIMECNSGVMMKNLINQLSNGYQLAKDIYKEAIIEMFKD